VIIADANLILYRYLNGPLTPLAEVAVARDPDWRTTNLWRCEFTSALVKMIRANVLAEVDALTAMRSAAADMIPREVDVPQDQALRAALQYGISAYDAQYIALAELLGHSCVTADGQLARKTPGVSVLLADFAK
jgi:predicted nucleic acid-binding protein